ncbi:MAG: lipoprotein insertase outer membrane protein LolB [Proteobacteria bacterium]|jgi:outer membrane lipoprotein LolB|nr:lipoprotein insertase outer membrane protein LolB [Pseudomonadota bacterium]
MKLLAGLVVLLLVGCAGPASIKPADPQQAWQARKLTLGQLAEWRMSGRVSIVRGSEVWYLNVRWSQHNANYDIYISGPLGTAPARLRGDYEQVALYDADQRVYTATNPERLLYDHTGIYMPVSGLRYWVLGLPDPGDNHTGSLVLDDYGRLTTLQQQDWQVLMSDYTDVGHLQLPERLEIRRNDVTVKLVVDDWRLTPG